MAFEFIIIFIVLVVTFTAAVIVVKLMRPGNKESSSLKSLDISAEEKRQHPRIDVNWSVAIETPKETINGVIRNIGAGGAFVICENPLPLNESARLTIETPLDQPLILNGKPIWTNVSVRDDKIVNKGMRIQFVHNPNENLKLLHQALVATNQQTLPDDETLGKTSGYESRKDSRIDVSWPVEMKTSLGNMKAETRHVSISGAFISCQEPLPLNEQFLITIIISEQKQISINAEVIWSNINVPDDKVVNRGMGIRFVNNAKDDVKPLSVALMKIIDDSFSPKD
ncbi:MAG: PilZ domain-containing protein [Deltaproteobacteria bacterium]|nr:PilZ domain-containing protein [Deltaproteobacteria bacterium]